MKDYIFNDCVEQVEKYSGRNVTFWPQLADKYNYEDKEAIRSAYRREARKRGYKLNNTKRSKDGPKILIFDLENTPMQGYFWNLWPQSISIDAIVRDWHLLSYSAKWLFEDEVISDGGDNAKQFDRRPDNHVAIIIIVDIASRKPRVVRREAGTLKDGIEVGEVHRTFPALGGMPEV